MKKNLMVLFAAVLLIFTAMPAFPAAAEVTATQEASYELPFKVLQEDKDEVSVAGDYVKSPAEVKVEDGKAFVYMTLLDSHFWQSLKIQDGDDFVDVEVVSENEEEQTRLVKFELKDVEKVLNAKAHIIVTGIPGIGEYDKTHDIRFQFDASEVPAEEGTEVEEETPETPEAPVAIEDGEYTIEFKVLHATEDKESPGMAGFIETPAALSVEGDKQVVTFTLTNNKQITAFQVEQNGEFVDATVVSVDEEANERVVSFEVADFSKIMNAKVTISVPERNHTGHHTIRLAFDQDSVEPVVTETPETPEAPAAIEDGEYTIGFKVLHATEEKESPGMARFIETPAALSVKDGKQVVTFKLTNNEQITAFQVEQEGEFVDATVVSVDEEANNRVVSFEVANFSEIMNAKVSVFVASANHTGHHGIRLAFDQESIVKVDAPVSFKDIDNTWAKPYIEALAAQQIVKGKSADTFAPNDKITRAQFALIIARALDLEKQEFQGTFSDVTKEMEGFVYEVESANRAGIILGDAGKFNPNAAITRQQMAAMIIRAIEFKDASLLKDVETTVEFADASHMSGYAKEAVQLAASLGIVDGNVVKGQKVFEPKANATRAHAVKMVHNMLEKIK